MGTPDVPLEELKPIEPLIGGSAPTETAAETMLAASRTMLAAAASLSSALGPSGARWRSDERPAGPAAACRWPVICGWGTGGVRRPGARR